MRNQNLYGGIIEFRQASYNDLDNIMNFIKRFWSSSHIFATDKEFLIYEHGNSDRSLNFIIGFDVNTEEVRSIQGFIPYSDNIHKLHVCGVFAKVHPQNDIPLLGVETMKKMLEFTNPITYCGIGTNPKTMLPIVKKVFKRHTGIMSHFYMVNREIKDFRIAIPNFFEMESSKTFGHDNSDQLIYEEVNTFSDLEKQLALLKISNKLPFKSPNYIKKRYFKNPIYKYRNFKILDDMHYMVGLLVTREVKVNNSICLHIADYIGEISCLGKIGHMLETLLNINNYEYIDCLCTGLEDTLLEKSGFRKKVLDGGVVIPSHFEPFIQKNIEIHFEKSELDLVLFKGDADADRPSFQK